MVIDTSAIMAIIYAEPEELIFIELINESADCLLSSPGYVEASIVLGTKHGQQWFYSHRYWSSELLIDAIFDVDNNHPVNPLILVILIQTKKF